MVSDIGTETPAGGPNTFPILLSTLDSTLFWKSCGVVVELKFEFIMTCSSDLYFLKKELISVVFAEPCSPMRSRFLCN